MRFKRSFTKGLLIALSFSLIPISAFSAQKVTPGSKCKVLKQKVSYQEKTYACIKSGKKLIWSKGSVIVQKEVVPIPLSSPVVIPNLPTSFTDLSANLQGISYGAWLKSKAKISTSNSVLGKLTVIVGPNTNGNNLLGKSGPGSLEERRLGMELVSKLYSDFSQVKNVTVFYYSFADVAWAQNQYDLFCDGSANCINPNIARISCPSPSPCWGATAGINGSNDGYLFLTVGDKGTYYQGGSLEAHEYMHTIQQNLYSPAGSKNVPMVRSENVPRWLSEGSAEWTQIASVFNSDYKTYMKERLLGFSFYDYYSNPSNYSVAWLKEFFEATPEKNREKYSGKNYQIGFLASEVLVSLKGPSSLMNLYKLMGEGESFEGAFKSEYGLFWSEAMPYIAEAISSQLQKKITS
jgi:hypothetical protein